MKRKYVSIFCALLLVGTLANVKIAYANNYQNASFSFKYLADETNIPLKPRIKEDKTASYVKLNSDSIGVKVFVAGTNDTNECSAAYQNKCLRIAFAPKGRYTYISNTVYGKYKYAYLLMKSDMGGAHWVKGQWSSDNISDRY